MKKSMTALLTSLLLASCSTQQTPASAGTANSLQQIITPPGRTLVYRTSGSQILNLWNRPFVVKGASVAYHTFMTMDDGGYGEADFQHLADQLEQLKLAGVNLVRIFVMREAFARNPALWERLDKVIGASQGMVVLVANSYDVYSPATVAFLQSLAKRYKDQSSVWLTPMNEPNCALPEALESARVHCEDWAVWRQEQSAYVQAIRSTGFRGPLLLNSISYSQHLEEILNPAYSIKDPLNNLIYGAHRYADDNPTWTPQEQAEVQAAWGFLTPHVPLVVDEVGADNGSEFLNSLDWMKGFMPFLKTWVTHEGGDGAIAFTSYTSDGNSLFQDAGYTGEGDVPTPVLPLQWTQWGALFVKLFLN